jgi:hypothetical protein
MSNSKTLKQSPEKEFFLEWLAADGMPRSPSTQSELAKMLGLHPMTLCNWKSDPQFLAELMRRVRANCMHRVRGMLARGAARTQSDDVRAPRLVLELLRFLNSKANHETEKQGLDFEQILRASMGQGDPPSWLRPLDEKVEGALQGEEDPDSGQSDHTA